jgi:uncharacterized protein
MDRRSFLRTGLLATAAFTTMGRAFWTRAFASTAAAGPSPYGPLSVTPDANGIRLPAGFTAREIGRAGGLVPGTAYPWHIYPDGGGTFATPDGGWILVSNSEVSGVAGGASAIRFDASGTIVDAYRILAGTNENCSGGATPWGTWLSCEEHETGLVWECDPTGASLPVARPAMGTFQHEAAAVDPILGHVYMTEDRSDGRFYRFTPSVARDLSAGLLEAMAVAPDGRVSWLEIPQPYPAALGQSTRLQVPETTAFNGGEGCFFDAAARVVYFTTKNDQRVWAFDVDAQTLEVLYDRFKTPSAALSGVDAVTVSRSGDLFVAEDGGNMEVCIITPERIVAPLLQVLDQPSSEITGLVFDPSGTRLYFNSQRGNRLGISYEVTGPFRASA